MISKYKRKTFEKELSHMLQKDEVLVHGQGTEPGLGVEMVLLGEAPGREEAIDGTPFIGKAGQQLGRALNSAGIARSLCWLTNVATIRPPKNNIDSDFGRELLDLSIPGLWEELDYIREREPTEGSIVLMALGNIAMHALGITGNVSKNRGSVYEVTIPRKYRKLSTQAEYPDFLVIPTYHPSFIARGSGGRFRSTSNGKVDEYLTWIADFRKARDISQNGWTALKENFFLNPTLNDITTYVDDAIAHGFLIAADIETTGLDLIDDSITLIGLAHSSEDALVVPFVKQGGIRYWANASEEYTVKQELSRLFTSCESIFQNAVFDVPRMTVFGIDIDFDKVLHDTLALHHAIDPELPHNLGYIVSVYGLTPYWKEDHINREGSALERPDIDYRTYNARDCVVLHQVLEPLLRDLEESTNGAIYFQETMPLLRTTFEMVLEGVPYDIKKRDEWAADVLERLSVRERSLLSIADLPTPFEYINKKTGEVSLIEGFNLRSSDHMAKLLFGITPDSYEDSVERAAKKTPGTKTYAEEATKAAIYKMEPLYVPPRLSIRTSRKTKKPSTDETSRLSYRIQVQNRLRDLKNLRRPTKDHKSELLRAKRALEFLSEYEEWAHLEKLRSTYSNLTPSSDGRIHCSMKVYGTATGRYACVSGNTLVSTILGQKRIDQIYPGEYVLTHKGNWRRVNKVYYKGLEHMQEIVVSSGERFNCTGAHRVLTPDGWKCADYLKEGDTIVYVSQYTSVKRRNLTRDRYQSLYLGKETEDRRCCERVRDYSPYSHIYTKRNFERREVQSRKSSSLFTFKNRRSQSHVGKVWTVASQLYRRMRRWLRLLNRSCRWVEVLSASDSNGKVSWNTSKGSSFGDDCTSPRRKSAKQFYQQLSNDYYGWACGTSPETVKIVSKTSVGSVGVWDLEVEEDHSYLAEGVFHHNSSDPNLQNIPRRREKACRKPFVALPGHKIVSLDYSNLEVRTMAYACGDQKLIDLLESGESIHALNTKLLFGMDDPSHPYYREAYDGSKTFFFGGVSYGGGDRKIYNDLLMQCPHMNLTFRAFQEGKERYFQEFPKLREWQDTIREQVRNTRRVTSPLGRTRTFYRSLKDIEKEALNFPNQSGAASIINRAQIRVVAALKEANFRAKLQIQIHDDLRFHTPEDEIDDLIRLAIPLMEQPVEFNGIPRSFPVDPEVGDSWYTLEAVDKETILRGA